MQRKIRADAISDTIKLKVRGFYIRDDISRIMPNKRDVIKMKNEKGEKIPIPKRLMSLT